MHACRRLLTTCRTGRLSHNACPPLAHRHPLSLTSAAALHQPQESCSGQLLPQPLPHSPLQLLAHSCPLSLTSAAASQLLVPSLAGCSSVTQCTPASGSQAPPQPYVCCNPAHCLLLTHSPLRLLAHSCRLSPMSHSLAVSRTSTCLKANLSAPAHRRPLSLCLLLHHSRCQNGSCCVVARPLRLLAHRRPLSLTSAARRLSRSSSYSRSSARFRKSCNATKM